MSYPAGRRARPFLAALSAALSTSLPLAAKSQVAAPVETHLDEIAIAGIPANAPADAVGAEAAALLRKPSLTQASPVGLNLRTPSRGASRLGLTPLETPASLDIVSGETIRLRGQSSVLEAVSQNGTGITAFGSPGFGIGAFTARGFAGQNSIQTLFDGTRLYVGANTLTFPFDTWNVERIEVLRGPASVLYGEGAIGRSSRRSKSPVSASVPTGWLVRRSTRPGRSVSRWPTASISAATAPMVGSRRMASSAISRSLAPSPGGRRPTLPSL